MNIPLKPLKNNQSRFKHSGRMAFRTSLAQRLIYEWDFRKGQMHVRMIILCFAIEVLFLKCTASVQCVFFGGGGRLQ